MDVANQAVENLVTQFSSALDFYRELVQNSIDAGSAAIDIWLDFVPDEDGGAGGVIEIHVDDHGEGMNEEIIDEQLTTLFSSSKENDQTKIGKFGIGFVSVFAPKPRAVLVQTGRGGEYWEVLFDQDRSFTKARLSTPVEGTQITLFLEGDRALYTELVSRSLETVDHWCRHSEAEITFEDRASLDGVSALSDGRSKWITSEAARADGHRWRARACAVLTGIGTVKADNPALTVRMVPTPRQPVKVLIDSRLEANPAAEIFHEARVLVLHAVPEESLDPGRAARLEDVGCTLVSLPGPRGKVDLVAAMQELGRREFNEVHVEAGHKLNGSLIAAGCIDEVLVYLAPSLLGQGQPMFDLPEISDLERRVRLEWIDMDRVGEDLRLRARLPGAASAG